MSDKINCCNKDGYCYVHFVDESKCNYFTKSEVLRAGGCLSRAWSDYCCNSDARRAARESSAMLKIALHAAKQTVIPAQAGIQ
jgi:hypothetical protein